ncbi:serine hydrolase domain-containing protein [Streptomyces sp. NPDC048290]|uniref:serine hydrolase domain-containing protein n=1 Tax=Streptomyces sp. NPDC048290 TaxID=3155811 RepID=UPI003419B565
MRFRPRYAPSRRLLSVAALLAALVVPVTAPPPAAASGLGDDLTARLDQAIAQVQREAKIPGLVVGLWMPGKGEYVRSTGVADTSTRQPMTDDLYVRIGSETKTFTVTALLQLVQEGRAGLDDPVARYVPGVPDGGHITLRQLAEMRSGLFPYTSDAGFDHDLLSDPDRRFTPQELLAYGYRHPNVFPPGERFQYSNSNLILLGLVIEKLTGRPLDEVIQQRVLNPAGLRHTVFPTDAAIPDPHAQGYTDQTLDGQITNSTHWDPTWAWAAGAMISNLQDLRRWAKTVATGELLDAHTQSERLTFLPTGVPGTGYGLGIFDSGGWIGHNGSLPGYETVTVYLPSEQATLVILLNTDITYQGQEPSSLVARAVTGVVTPDHLYGVSVRGR